MIPYALNQNLYEAESKWVMNTVTRSMASTTPLDNSLRTGTLLNMLTLSLFRFLSSFTHYGLGGVGKC